MTNLQQKWSTYWGNTTTGTETYSTLAGTITGTWRQGTKLPEGPESDHQYESVLPQAPPGDQAAEPQAPEMKAQTAKVNCR